MQQPKREPEIVRVIGSDGVKQYEVCVVYLDRGLTMSCNCAAGDLGKLCRHKLAILLNDSGVIVGEFSSDLRDRVSASLAKSEIPSVLDQIRDGETAIQEGKKRVSRLKHELERLLRNGG